MEIIQITGYKNSGKTTFAEMLLTSLSNQDIHVASLKHHGHGGPPAGFENTDSEKHRRAGAFLAGVEGDGVFQLTANQPWCFSEMAAIYEMLGVEVLVVEGFKYESFPKIVMLANPEDVRLLYELNDIQAVVSAIELDAEDFPYPIYRREEAEVLCRHLCNEITKTIKNKKNAEKYDP
jgi:molybdopterin-guanine dinucleotide biosynthesis protein B